MIISIRFRAEETPLVDEIKRFTAILCPMIEYTPGADEGAFHIIVGRTERKQNRHHNRRKYKQGEQTYERN